MDNYQAIAYAILAMERKGYSQEQMSEIKGSMMYMMDMKSKVEAEKQADKIMNR